MNKVYKVIWNAQLGCWQAVSELAKSHTGSQSATTESNNILKIGQKVSQLIMVGLAILPLSIHAAISNTELPTGAQINSGAANISQTGNTLNINQNGQNLSTNWNTFNIGKDATVNFNQQNQSSVAINHVKDSNASQIMGRLNANGQVFLLNPNGVVFSKTAQVNVGGMVASTLSLSDKDIQNGKYSLKGDANSIATIENHGTINTLQGGAVALIAPNVRNTGTIKTPNGTTHLTSASQVTLALQDGSLTQYQVNQGVLKGLVENGGAIVADNGAVYLTAKAKDSLSKAVVNHSGIIEANRLTHNAKGEIILLGDMQSGETNVSGTLKAEGKNGADGGFIETSAAKVNIVDSTKVSTLSDRGKTGEWLIDPTDFSINAGSAIQTSSEIGATTLQANLANTNMTLQTANTGGGKGNININVNADVTWNSATSLTLNAHNDININANITATNNNGKLNLIYGQNTANTEANYYINNGAKINLKAGLNFSTKKGTAAVKNYQVITTLGTQGSTTKTDLQGINGGLAANYVLGSDIDASVTSGWDNGAGFNPIGNDLTTFSGVFDGLNHTVNGLTINRPSQYNVGLFGFTNGATIKNIGLINANIQGDWYVGALIGSTQNTTTNHAYSTGQVKGTWAVGGLIGYNTNKSTILSSYSTAQVSASDGMAGGLTGENYDSSSIENSYATGVVRAQRFYAGGLSSVNFDNSVIKNSYATGAVSGSAYVGGLLGLNIYSTVDNSYATGLVARISGSQTTFGGLVGWYGGTINNSFWNPETTGQSKAVGDGSGVLSNVLDLTTAQMQNLSTFKNAGWSISGIGGENTVWRIYEGSTSPLLRSFLTQATISPTDKTVTYNGQTQSLDTVNFAGLDNSKIFGSQSSSKNVGDYLLQYYSNQQGYDLIGNTATLTINKAQATVTGNSLNTTYNGQDQTVAGFTATGLVNGEDTSVLIGVTASAVTAKDAGTYQNTATGTDKNYDLTFVNGELEIAKAQATVTTKSDQTTYNGKDQTVAGFTATGLVNGETESVLTGVTASVTGKDAGTYQNTATGTDKNYDLTFVNGELDIAKAQATVTGNSLNTTYNGQDQTITGFTVQGLVNGETTSVLSGVTATVTGKDAGSYANKASGVDKNYDLTLIDGALDIEKAKATVTANSLNTVYNGKDQTASGFTAQGLVGGETESVLTGVTATVTGKDAGSYANKASGVDKNYDLTLIDGSLDIEKAKATVTANSVNTTYNGKDQTATGFTATGLVGGETESVLTGVTATVTGKNAGSYANKASGVDKNYDLTLIDGSLDIAKVKATVTANSVNTTYNGKDQTASGFSATGLVNGETTSVLSGVTATVTGKDAGSYANKASGVDKNYDLTLIDGSLDIAKAKATVTANSVNTTYNGKGQTATGFSATGLVNGETISVLSGITATVTGKDADQYTNKATGTDQNYELSFIDGSLDIAKAQATVTANSVNTTYNGKDQTASGFTAQGLVNGETESVLTGVTASITAKNAGKYTNTATGIDQNYDLTFVDGGLDIAKAKINQVTGITANNRIYDATRHAILNTGTAQFEGIVTGDQLTVVTATGQFNDKNVGTAKNVAINNISLSGTDSHNYELVKNTAQTTADISKANISAITGITANSRVYDGLTDASLNTANSQFNGLYAGDQLTVATATGQFESASTGQNKTVSITGLSLAGTDAQNYNLVDHTASTQANIYMLTPANYLQAIQFKRPSYLPESDKGMHAVNIEVRQGGVNTTGLQTLAGEH